MKPLGARPYGVAQFDDDAALRLATLTLSNGNAWVHTDDGTLWLVPERDGYGIGYGYSGTGCFTLARLIDALLDDITAPAVAPGSRGEPPCGLFVLLNNSDDTTCLHPRPADRCPHPDPPPRRPHPLVDLRYLRHPHQNGRRPGRRAAPAQAAAVRCV
jgi:hypothetical protein